MSLFYEYIQIKTSNTIVYQYFVLGGVSFRDQKGLTVQITKQRYKNNNGDITLESTSASLVCGRKTYISK